jgi:hypothetical protein
MDRTVATSIMEMTDSICILEIKSSGPCFNSTAVNSVTKIIPKTTPPMKMCDAMCERFATPRIVVEKWKINEETIQIIADATWCISNMSYRIVKNDAYVATMIEMCPIHVYVVEEPTTPKYRVAVIHVKPDPHSVVANTELSFSPSDTVRMYPSSEKHPIGKHIIPGILRAMRNK